MCPGVGGGHWSWKTSLANMKSESTTNQNRACKGGIERFSGRGKQCVKGYVVGRDYRTF